MKDLLRRLINIDYLRCCVEGGVENSALTTISRCLEGVQNGKDSLVNRPLLYACGTLIMSGERFGWSRLETFCKGKLVKNNG